MVFLFNKEKLEKKTYSTRGFLDQFPKQSNSRCYFKIQQNKNANKSEKDETFCVQKRQLTKIMQRIPHAIEVSVAHNLLNSVDKTFKSCFSIRLFSAILMPLKSSVAWLSLITLFEGAALNSFRKPCVHFARHDFSHAIQIEVWKS